MLEGRSETAVEALDAIEREVATCREELRDLESRTRVMEVESRAWKPPSAGSARPDAGAFIGFFFGVFGMVGLGTLIGALLKLVR
jgi:hypothetical protein